MSNFQVTKTKKWKEICGVVNIGASASAAFTLKKNYIKYLFSYECKFDKGGIDPAPILAQMEAALQQKRESKNRARAPSPGKIQQIKVCSVWNLKMFFRTLVDK